MITKSRHYKRNLVSIISTVILGIIIVFLAAVMTRDVQDVEGEIMYQIDEKPLNLTGITSGQAAIGSASEIKTVYGGDNPAPIASMAKIITALVVLERSNDLDQIIVLDAQDEAFFSQTIAANGSNLHVVAGEQLTLRQMLEALLMISANNMADSLVYHLFGSQENYQVAADNWLASHGFNQTKIGADASGFDPGTLSSPSEMIKIGQIALDNSVVSQIVKTKKAAFPLVNEVENTNKLLGEDYFGIKTGNSDEAGSCLLFATKHEGETIVGVLMGQPFNTTFTTAKQMVAQVEDSFSLVAIPAGTEVGKYILPWGGEIHVRTTQEISRMTWGDVDIDVEIKPYQRGLGQTAGLLRLADQASNLEIAAGYTEANLWWRLAHLGQLKW